MLITLLLGCRNKEEDREDKKKEDTKFFSTPPEDVAELATNRLAKEPTAFLRSQASSAINWQPWTPEITDLAERSQRLILVFVGSTSHPQSFSTAKLLESKFADEINAKYVPVLADVRI